MDIKEQEPPDQVPGRSHLRALERALVVSVTADAFSRASVPPGPTTIIALLLLHASFDELLHTGRRDPTRSRRPHNRWKEWERLGSQVVLRGFGSGWRRGLPSKTRYTVEVVIDSPPPLASPPAPCVSLTRPIPLELPPGSQCSPPHVASAARPTTPALAVVASTQTSLSNVTEVEPLPFAHARHTVYGTDGTDQQPSLSGRHGST